MSERNNATQKPRSGAQPPPPPPAGEVPESSRAERATPSTPFYNSLRPKDITKQRAIELRQTSSVPERILWEHLRAGRLNGLKFRRQHPLGPFIADFYCHKAGLVVEVDGKWTHGGGTPRGDAGRDEWMRARGLEILRVAAASVNEHAEGVARRIETIARERIEKLGRVRTIEAE
jgi:very-short-patch-repair endonuclease